MKQGKENITISTEALSKCCAYVLLFVMLVVSSGILTSFADYIAEDTLELTENSETEKDSSEEESEMKNETDDFIHFLNDPAAMFALQELESIHGPHEHNVVHLEISSPPPKHA